MESILGNFVTLIRVRNEDFFEKPDDDVLRHCDGIKKELGIVRGSAFGNYTEAVEALKEFEKKYDCEEIEVPEFYNSVQLYYSFTHIMEQDTFSIMQSIWICRHSFCGQFAVFISAMR